MDRTSLAEQPGQHADINGRRVERVFHPSVPLRSALIDELIAACNGSPKAEVCGLITETQWAHFIENVHETPQNNFLMDRNEFKEVVRGIMGVNHEKIIGVFHSHPHAEPWPTPRDIAGWPNPELGWRYFIITHNDVIEWRLL